MSTNCIVLQSSRIRALSTTGTIDNTGGVGTGATTGKGSAGTTTGTGTVDSMGGIGTTSAPFTTFLAARGCRLDFDAEISRGHPFFVDEHGTNSGPVCNAPAIEKSESQYRVQSPYSSLMTGEYVNKGGFQPFSWSQALGMLSMYQVNDWTNQGTGVEVYSSWGPLVAHDEVLDDCGEPYTGYWEDAMLDQVEVRFQCNQPAPQELRQHYVLLRKDKSIYDIMWPAASCVGIIELRIPAGEMISRQAISESPLPSDIELTAGTIKMTAPVVDLNQDASYDLLPVEVMQTQLAQDGYSVQGGLTQASTFRLARWQDAWDTSWQTKSDFIASDRDRVQIRMPSSAFPNLSAGSKPIVKIECASDTTKLEMNLNGGFYESEPFLFVADADDDKSYNGKAGIGEANDGKLNDQTISAGHNHTVKISFENAGSLSCPPFVVGKIRAPVHTLQCELVYVSEDGSVPAQEKSDIEYWLQEASETFAQIGITLSRKGEVKGTQAPQEYWQAIDQDQLTYQTSRIVAGQEEWFSGWIRNQQPSVGDFVRVFFVPISTWRNVPTDNGPTDVAGLQELKWALVCTKNLDKEALILAHEVAHFAGQKVHADGARNLMQRTVPNRTFDHLDGKRFRLVDEQKIKDHQSGGN